VSNAESSPRLPDIIIAIAGVAGAVLLWVNRDVMPADVALRSLLPVCWLVFWSLATFGAGAAIFRRLTSSRTIEVVDLPIALLTGAGVLAAISSFFAIIGLFRAPVLGVLLASCALVGIWEFYRTDRVAIWRVIAGLPVAVLPLAAVAAVLIPVLTAPPVMYDSLNYHLAFPDHWLAAGRFIEFPRHGFSYYPSSYGALYGFALATVGPWAATAIHYWFGVLGALTAASLGSKIGGKTTAVWAAACYGLTPAVLEVATYAAADLAVAAWGGAALFVLLTGDHKRRTPGRAALCGFLIGCAVAAKYLALAVVLLPLVIAAVPMFFGAGRKQIIRTVLVFAFAAAIPLAPWLGRNLVWTGNPLYPYLQTLLGGPATDMSIGGHMMQIGGASAGTLTWAWSAATALVRRTIDPLAQGGLLGPQWLLLLPVAAFTVRRKTQRTFALSLWLFTLTGLATWGSLVQMARFLLPVLIPAAALAGSAAAALVSLPETVLRWSFRILLATIFFWNATMIVTTQNFERLGIAGGFVAAEDYLQRWASYYPVVDYLNQDLPQDARVLFVAEPRSMYVNRPVVVEDPFTTPLLVEMAAGSNSGREIARKLIDSGVTHVLVNTVEMPLSAKLRGLPNYWSNATNSERARIDEFLNRWVTRTKGSAHLWIGQVIDPAPPPTSSSDR